MRECWDIDCVINAFLWVLLYWRIEWINIIVVGLLSCLWRLRGFFFIPGLFWLCISVICLRYRPKSCFVVWSYGDYEDFSLSQIYSNPISPLYICVTGLLSKSIEITRIFLYPRPVLTLYLRHMSASQAHCLSPNSIVNLVPRSLNLSNLLSLLSLLSYYLPIWDLGR